MFSDFIPASVEFLTYVEKGLIETPQTVDLYARHFRDTIYSDLNLDLTQDEVQNLSAIAWCRLTDEDVQFTVIPEKASQCWCKLSIDTIFERYTIQSASPKNTINLELPLAALTRALQSARSGHDVSIRLTKKDDVPVLCLTILDEARASFVPVVQAVKEQDDEYGDFDVDVDLNDPAFGGEGQESFRDRNTVITQDIPVKVLSMETVSTLHEPRLREPDVHIYMPELAQVKAISDKFTKMAISMAKNTVVNASPKLEMSMNMHGQLKLGVNADALSISSHWQGLENPALDPSQFGGGEDAVREHPSTKMKERYAPDDPAGYVKVRIDAKDWSRVLSVGRVSNRVIGCIVDNEALVMYCWIKSQEDDEESCLTYYIQSYSA